MTKQQHRLALKGDNDCPTPGFGRPTLASGPEGKRSRVEEFTPLSQIYIIRSVGRLLIPAFGVVIMLSAVSLAQIDSNQVTIKDLSAHSRDYEGQLVQLRAFLSVGWESDNFLTDPPTGWDDIRTDVRPKAVNQLYFYCDHNHARLCGRLLKAGMNGITSTIVSGRLHYLADEKSAQPRKFNANIFTAPSLRLEITEVLELNTSRRYCNPDEPVPATAR